jgi:hypothetical protein
VKLTELNPSFVGYGGEGISDKDGNTVPRREGVGLHFDCPCGCDQPCFVYFSNPLDGGATVNGAGPAWTRTGTDFETLTLAPSILRSKERGGCGWHGWITDGEVRSA